jgi:type VI protein secretion system component Hcp
MVKIVIDRVAPGLYRAYVNGKLVAEGSLEEVSRAACGAVESAR